MATLNLTLRQDDGSYIVMDMNLTDEDSRPLADTISDFLSQHSDRLNVPSTPPQMVSEPSPPTMVPVVDSSEHLSTASQVRTEG